MGLCWKYIWRKEIESPTEAPSLTFASPGDDVWLRRRMAEMTRGETQTGHEFCERERRRCPPVMTRGPFRAAEGRATSMNQAYCYGNWERHHSAQQTWGHSRNYFMKYVTSLLDDVLRCDFGIIHSTFPAKWTGLLCHYITIQ